MLARKGPAHETILEDQQRKDWFGYLRATIGGKRMKSQTFRGPNKTAVRRQLQNWNRLDADSRDGFDRLLDEKTPGDGTYTVSDYLYEWFCRAKHAWRRSTIATHTSTFETWLIRDEAFNVIPFKHVKKADVQAFFDRLPCTVSAPTRHRIHALLHQAFQAAVIDERLATNVAQTSTKPKKPRRKTVEELHPEHEAALTAFVARDPYWNALILLALDSGMREAEILGLQVREVDFVVGSVYVRRTCNTIPDFGPVIEEYAKSDDSIRDIPLHEETMKALRGLCHGKDPLEHVFTDNGALWHRSAFYSAWTALLKRARVPHYRFHALRHTCATALLRDHMYLTAVSRRLGHSKPSVTLDFYSSCLPTDAGPLVRSFGARLARHRSQKFAEGREIGTPIGTQEDEEAA